jgi:hypothetical protein
VFVVCCADSGLCYELITRSDESTRACVCLIVSDLETSTVRGPRTDLGCCVTQKKIVKDMTGHGMIRGIG